jgi:lipopolysaccharide export system protein LptA
MLDNKQHATNERIKAWVFFGVEAEMELVSLHTEVRKAIDIAADTEDDDDIKSVEYLRGEIAIKQDQIALANKRIGELGG